MGRTGLCELISRCASLALLAGKLLAVALLAGKLLAVEASAVGLNEEVVKLRLKSAITHVQPMTGIVLWSDHPQRDTEAIQLEYRYCGYDEVVKPDGSYDYSILDSILDDVASRNHQAVLRFYFVYPGRKSTVPEFIRSRADYTEVVAKSEGKETHFCDWSNAALQQFTLDFYARFAARYDNDPRLAFLQTGFGLWAEYHIYDGPRTLGKTFPDKAFQARFLKQLDSVFSNLPWMISIDAADSDYTAIEDNQELLALGFGVFDDSFLCKPHPKENAVNWRIMNPDRWKRAPGGGEFSYYNKKDQKQALAVDGPNGVSFEKASRQFHISFMIGNDQPKYQSMDRIASAGQATGYRLRVTGAERIAETVVIEVTNEGVAPMYRDAYFAIGESRSSESLKGLLPGESRRCEIADPGFQAEQKLRIVSEHILPAQQIQFLADLP